MIWYILSGFVGLALGASAMRWACRTYFRYERRVQWWVVRRVEGSHRRILAVLKRLVTDRQLLVSQREAIAAIIAAEGDVVVKVQREVAKLSREDLEDPGNWTPREQAKAGKRVT